MIRINLLKPEKKEVREAPDAPIVETRERSRQPLWGLILLVAAAAIAVLFFYQRNEIKKEEDLLARAQAEKRSLEYVETKLLQLEQQRDLLQRKIDLIQDLKARQTRAVIIMDEISRNIPDWVWLMETNVRGNDVRIRGRAISNTLLADYIHNLEVSPYFHQVKLLSSTQRRVRNNQYYEFSMTAVYLPEGSAESSSAAAKEVPQ